MPNKELSTGMKPLLHADFQNLTRIPHSAKGYQRWGIESLARSVDLECGTRARRLRAHLDIATGDKRSLTVAARCQADRAATVRERYSWWL
jgi:hypothetical protein